MGQFSHLKEAFDRDGFLVVRDFIPPAELRDLAANIDRYIRDIVPGLPDAVAFYQDRARPETLKQLQHMGRDAYFAAWRSDPRCLDLARTLLGVPVEAKEPEWFNKPPGTEHPTPPHQDNYYFCLEPPDVLTIWVAMDVIDEENGCLRYLPASHRAGRRRHQASNVLGFSQGITDYAAADTQRERVIKLQPGDATVHHGETVHRADPNRSSTRHRRAFAMVMQGTTCRTDEAAMAAYQAALKSQHEGLGLEVK